MDRTGLSRHFVDGQGNVIRSTGLFAAGGSERIRHRANGRVRQRHGRLELLGRITRGRFVHGLDPDRQGQGCAVTVRNNCGWLVESDPNAAGQCRRVANEPRIFVIVCCSGLARGWNPEAQGRSGGRGRAPCQNLFH